MSRAGETKLTHLMAEAPPPGEVRGNRIGRLVGWSDEQAAPLVDYPGNPHGPVAARSLVAVDAAAGTSGPEILLTFDGERSDRPVILGFLQPAHPAGRGRKEEAAPPVAPREAAAPLEAVVDGNRVVIEGRDEIVLRCGEASITLRRNGRVIVRGTYVETRARGTNRIRGGTVEIN